MAASKAIRRIDAACYPQYQDLWDHLLFRDQVLAALKPTDRVLDLGAGAGITKHLNFRGFAQTVSGLDLQPAVLENPLLDEARVGSAENIPWADSSFDVVLAHNVLEHVASPLAVFREVARVLRPGGTFLVRTPNRRHYTALLARVTPRWVHVRVNLAMGLNEADVFRKFYRANTKAALDRLARESGLQTVSIRRIEGRPEYTRIWAPLYLLGLAYERLVNSSEIFEPLRVVLMATFQKRN